MYDQLPSEIRDSHPYFMYEEIKAQPAAVQRSIQHVERDGAEVTRVVARARRVFVTGCGTSWHAAQGGAWFLRSFSRGKIDARAVEAHDVVSYLPGLRPDDLLIALSHSGTTVMTQRAMERAHGAGVETLLVTGFPDSPAGKLARYLLPTGYPEEHSWAHTASYSAALASLAALANTVADPEERLDLTPLPAVMQEALTLEGMMHNLAGSTLVVERYRETPRIFLTGPGPNAVTAQEGVLKLLETSYVEATPFPLEEILHGPLAAVDENSLVIILAPDGQSTARAAQLSNAVRELGTVPVVLCAESNVDAFEEAHRLMLPDLPEVLSPIPYVVPLQFFAYYLAIGRDVNPDLIHRDDERQRTARGRYE